MTITLDQAMSIIEGMANEAQRKTMEIYGQVADDETRSVVLVAARNFETVAQVIRAIRADDDQIEAPMFDPHLH